MRCGAWSVFPYTLNKHLLPSRLEHEAFLAKQAAEEKERQRQEKERRARLEAERKQREAEEAARQKTLADKAAQVLVMLIWTSNCTYI